MQTNGAECLGLTGKTNKTSGFQTITKSWMSRITGGICLCVFTLVFLDMPLTTFAQRKSPEDDIDRCDPNITSRPRVCERGLMLPVWPPAETALLTNADIAARAIVYLLSLVFLFLGVSIIADRFMASIEVITSKEKEVVYRRSDGEFATTTVRIWNETVSNLTLMALGSSAPEIMLSVIEVMRKGFHAGDLGPSTIVGSASFNLFIIIAICMYVIPDDEHRKIKHPRVFFITAAWSILAYIWLYIILAVSSRGIVEIWEGVLTFLFFPILVVLAWIADRRLLVYKYMHKRYRTRHKKIIVETEGGAEPEDHKNSDGVAMVNMGDGEDDTLQDEHAVQFLDGNDVIDPESNRKTMIRLMRELRKKHPDADMNELAKLASAETLNKQTKSRAFYRIQATRLMTGAGNILNKGKNEQMKSDDTLSNVLEDVDDSVAKVSFDPSDYKVMENCGYAKLFVVRSGGDLNSTLYVDFATEDGTANAGSDFELTEDTVVFKPGETIRTIKIKILDDDIFEEDEYFRVKLFNVRTGSPDGMFDTNGDSKQIARLEPPAVANVVILDDDHAGVFSFPEPKQTVSEGVGILKVEVARNSGARGKVLVPYKTVPGTAKGGGEDFVDAIGELEFENDETTKCISIQIEDDEEYEKNKSFSIELSTPRLVVETLEGESGTDAGSDSGINGKDDDESSKLISEEEEEARRIAELGKPRLGINPCVEIVIEESYEFKNTVDRLIKKANLAVIVGTSSWREQFVDALTVNGGEDDEGDDEGESEPTCFDYVMHFLTVFWKLLFAFVPPTDYVGGWACFTVSIILIGFLTAVIGDVASHFGCVVNLNDAVTAVTLVAMGTSVPDTFASKVAAVGDEYADASIGNVTGSNAVNVFLGIGIAWTISAIYWMVVGADEEERYFRVRPGNLAFSVTVFSVFAVIAVAVLMIRRKSKRVGAELGGPRKYKIASSLVFVMLWVIYILLSALDSYCIIKTF
uniref:Sodium/calcium exchanger 1 n=1 Tax=Phallusia mammillata TaxID=59560 RepID=A0A6F9DSB6_9ASCI|nr:sodium/calcium exchanger 1 [Phallusia mammillata]